MAHRGNYSPGGGSTAIRVGKYTPTSYYSGKVRTEKYKHPPLVSVRLAGGHSAKVPKSPRTGSGGKY